MNSESGRDSLLDYVSVGICIIDKEYRVIFWNEYLEEYTSISKDEICGKLIFDFFPGFNNEIYRERVDNIFNGWPPVILSSRLHAPFFTPKEEKKVNRFQEITISPVPLPDESYNALITINDVTDITKKLEDQNILYKRAQKEIQIRKEIQEKLKESEQHLQELISTKDKFFSIIAHDLKNPFNALLGMSSLLIESCKAEDFSQVEKYGQFIHESSESAYNLLVNLLDWSRLQLGKFPYNPEKINIECIIDEMIFLLKSVALNKNIQIEKKLTPVVDFIADRNMISTTIRNLLTNAIKYSYKGGKVAINTSIKGNELVISISDSGIGIKDSDIKKLFKIDNSFSMPGTAKESGTGLGLILCKEFVETHKGEIWVESEIEKGSTFHFSIPLNIEA